MTYYRQCVLVKRATQQVAWIPEEFAVVGKHERDFLGHRKRTDV